MLRQQTSPVVLAIVFALFFATGLLGVIWPRSVQAFELEFYPELSPFFLVSMLRRYVGSDAYVGQLRIVGGFCLLVAGWLFYAVVSQGLGIRS